MQKTALALVSALAALPAPLLAGDGAWRVGNDQVHIVDGAVDLTSAAGRARLLAQVEKAAVTLCREHEGRYRAECEAQTVRQTAASGTAWAHALSLAVAERDRPALAAK